MTVDVDLPGSVFASGLPRTVRGYMYGPFLVHVNLDDETFWAVTHAGTGLAACTSCRSKRSAMKLARMLVASRIDWSFKKVGPRSFPSAARERATAIIERWRLA